MKKYKNITYEGYHPRILVTKEFADKNNLRLCRTQEEIIARAESSSEDFFGFSKDILLDYVDWEHSKQFYQKEFIDEVESGKAKVPKPIRHRYKAIQNMLDYMVFGWMKALDERGISASRTVVKLSEWLWLLGRDDLSQMVGDSDYYDPYGTPALVKLAKELGITPPKDLVEFSKIPGKF